MQGIWLYSYIALWIVTLAVAVGLVAVGRFIGSVLNQAVRASAPGQAQATGPTIGAQLWDDTTFPLQPGLVAVSDATTFVTVFVSSTCPHCQRLVPSLGAITGIPDVQPIVMNRDPIKADDVYAAELKGLGIPYIQATDLFEKNEVNMVPTIALVDRQGIVLAKRLGNDIGGIQEMINTRLAA